MGFFDEVSQRENRKTSIASAENLVRTLFQSYKDTYIELTESPSCSRIHNQVKDKGFNDFIKYFTNKGFEVFANNSDDRTGYTAKSGSFKVDFTFAEGEFHCSIRQYEYERITLIDKSSNERIFQGYADDNDVFIPGSVSDDVNRLKLLEKAAHDIQLDIDNLNKKINEQYEPNFYFELNERQKNVNSINEYLEIVDEELSNKRR
ncbi:hypothetical protein SB775_25835 [Peribacillus sp. SIMBA_075]|uniref:hypothetical protein n=1 Tax=Peribacillus sp. SIMBA_075 TaxID=3085813 RepID=UPI00397DA261